jgi:hypothetical protein
MCLLPASCAVALMGAFTSPSTISTFLLNSLLPLWPFSVFSLVTRIILLKQKSNHIDSQPKTLQLFPISINENAKILSKSTRLYKIWPHPLVIPSLLLPLANPGTFLLPVFGFADLQN